MRRQRINNIFLSITINSLISLLVVLFYKYVSTSFNIDLTIIWVEQNTKKFGLLLIVTLIILMLISKQQLLVIEKLRKSYRWAVSVFSFVYILLISMMMSLLTGYFLVYFQMLKESPNTLTWILENKSVFWVGTVLLFFIYLFLFSLLGNIYISSIITGVMIFVIGLIHYNKLNLRLEPLYPSDFSQLNQISQVIPMLKDYISPVKFLLAVIIFAIIFYLAKYMPSGKMPILARAILLIISAIMAFSLIFYQKSFMNKFVLQSSVAPIVWNQLDNYNKNGFIFGFLSNLQFDVFEEPDGYTKDKIISIAKKYQREQTINTNDLKLPKKPNIIFLMNEAFWDPTKLTTVQFSEDPLKNMRKLMENNTWGYNLSPAFGGGTANVEFEALTGFSNYFLKVGSLPYQDIIDRKSFIPTIVSDLENSGYRTVAIHPFDKIFYKRSLVYQTFGFDQFLHMDNMKNRQKSGQFISDESLTNEIIDQLNKQNKPAFIHAVSMQNHFDYNAGRYEKNTISVSGLPQDLSEKMEVYTEGVKQADQALQLLVDSLEQLDEPTIVVFWGDHLPILGENLGVYEVAKYGDKKDKNEYERKYSETPLLIYSNYDLEKKELNALSPVYFGPTVYELAGLKNPPFYNLLDILKEQLPGLKATVQIDGNQNYVTNHLTKEQKKLLKDYELIQYDLLVGKQYSRDILYNK